MLIKHDLKVLVRKGDLFGEFYEVFIVDRMRQGDLNVKLPHFTLLFHLGHMAHPTLLHSNLAFHDLSNVSELITALLGQALLMDEVVPFIIDVAGSEGGAAID